MTAAAQTFVSTGWAGDGFPILARITGTDGDPLQQADLTSITYRIRPRDRSEADRTGTLTISAVIFDTLQTGDWDTGKDASGYNFRWDTNGTLFPLPKDYEVFVYFNPGLSSQKTLSVLRKNS